MEVQVSPTPEETIISDIERELLSSSKDSEDHTHSAAEKETDRETEGDTALKRKILSKMERKMPKRVLGGESIRPLWHGTTGLEHLRSYAREGRAIHFQDIQTITVRRQLPWGGNERTTV
ncbi:hypothetical protein JTB14_024077 [Gonioctena quinquepunctata]|nr:hypothetical protein JTB14_024077 [Gonioctena quinquepunctata]